MSCTPGGDPMAAARVTVLGMPSPWPYTIAGSTRTARMPGVARMRSSISDRQATSGGGLCGVSSVRSAPGPWIQMPPARTNTASRSPKPASMASANSTSASRLVASPGLAVWITASASPASRAIKPWSRMSPETDRASTARARAAASSLRTSAVTSWPFPRTAARTAEPMNPVEPVSSTRMMILSSDRRPDHPSPRGCCSGRAATVGWSTPITPVLAAPPGEPSSLKNSTLTV